MTGAATPIDRPRSRNPPGAAAADPGGTASSPGTPSAHRAPRPAGALADPPPFRWPSLRPILGLLLFAVLLAGVVYPLAIYGVEQGTGAFGPGGAYVAGGDPTQLATTLIGQNITNDSLFWLRPSLTDYNATLRSGEGPYGPTDPNLVNLTRHYIAVYGLNNTTVPLDLVGNSESGLDPDLTPAAALVQIPRIAAHTHLSQAFLTSFVQERVVTPLLGFLGPSYVNVIALDTALLGVLAPTGG